MSAAKFWGTVRSLGCVGLKERCSGVGVGCGDMTILFRVYGTSSYIPFDFASKGCCIVTHIQTPEALNFETHPQTLQKWNPSTNPSLFCNGSLPMNSVRQEKKKTIHIQTEL